MHGLEVEYLQHTLEFSFLPRDLSFIGNVITIRLAVRLKLLIGRFESFFFFRVGFFLAIRCDVRS